MYNVNMQSLVKETNLPTLPSDCSAQLIEVIPVIMRRIRGEMRRRTMPGLAVPQFRTLNYLQEHPRASLSDVAAYLGLTLPSTSKLIQKLVTQKAVVRRGARDRRRVCLSLTQQGITALDQARLETQQQLAQNLSSLTQKELNVVSAALRVLNLAFSRGGAGVNIP
jgi:DNA-binding MarR family transcriptional regulator